MSPSWWPRVSHPDWPCGCNDQTPSPGGAGTVRAQPGSPSSCCLECLLLGSSPRTAVPWGAATLDCGRQLDSQAAARTMPGVRAHRLDVPARSGAPCTPLSPSAPRTRELELSRRHKPLGVGGHVSPADWVSWGGEVDSPPSPAHGSAPLLRPLPPPPGLRAPQGRGHLCVWRLQSA